MTDRDHVAISVILATHGRPDTLPAALDSLAAQTLDHALFEVVVVVNGPQGATTSVVQAFAARHRDLSIRIVQSVRPGVAHARQVGLWVARGGHMTILDDDDRVSPGYLAGLLEGVSSGVVPLAWLADVEADGSTEPDFENYYSTPLAALAPGEVISAEQMPQALALNVAKLVPVSIAREVGYDESLRGGSDFVFWTNLFARVQFRLRAPKDRDAVYFRTRSPDSLSRQETSFDFNVAQRLACVGSLESIDSPSPAVERMAAQMAASQFRLVNDFLLAHPERRDEVVDAVLAAGHRRTNWRKMNLGTARELVLEPSFPPCRAEAGVWNAMRVAGRGTVVDVIAQDLDGLAGLDSGTARVADPWVAQLRRVPKQLPAGSWAHAAGYARGVRDTLDDWRAKERPVDYTTVHSGSSWPASHLAAACHKLRHPEVRWVASLAEDPDPMPEESSPEDPDHELVTELGSGIEAAGSPVPAPEEGARVWARSAVLALADEIVLASWDQRTELLEADLPGPVRDRVAQVSLVREVATPPAHAYGADPVDLDLDPSRVNLALPWPSASGATMGGIVGAMLQLAADDRAGVVLHLLGTPPEDQHDEEDDWSAVRDQVRWHDDLSFLQQLNAMAVLDCVVVPLGTETVPGADLARLGRARGSGSPVWTVVEASHALADLGTEHRSQPGNVDQALQVLLELLLQARVERGEQQHS